MADDLRERLGGGSLDALTDPALPLHLLAELDSLWWQRGAIACALTLIRTLCPLMPRPDLMQAVEAWIGEVEASASAQVRALWYLEKAPAGNPVGYIEQAARTVTFGLPLPAHRRALVNLARRLRSRSPSAPSEVDEALAVLERYAV